MSGWKNVLALTVTASFAVALTGCGVGDDGGATASNPPIPKELLESPQLTANAGVPVPEAADPTYSETMKLAEQRPFATRGDVFALLGPERRFDQSERANRIFGQLGDFSNEYTPPEEKPAPEEQREPQPYRRLAGILLGDSVMAIIEMESGGPQLVRPGQQIPNSEWTVVSIDSEKAILRRGGNKLPREIAVPLESRRAGAGGGGGSDEGGGGSPGPGNTGIAPGDGGPPPEGGGIPGPPGGRGGRGRGGGGGLD